MLYKNLPEAELRSVMRVRALLDYVAALQFFVTGHFPNAKAVVQARIDFKKMKSDFAAARCDNLAAAVRSDLPERRPFLLLVQYYLRGRRRFAQL